MLEILKRFGVLDFHCTKNNNSKQLFPSSFSFSIPEGSLQVRIRLVKGNPWGKSICLTCL